MKRLWCIKQDPASCFHFHLKLRSKVYRTDNIHCLHQTSLMQSRQHQYSVIDTFTSVLLERAKQFLPWRTAGEAVLLEMTNHSESHFNDGFTFSFLKLVRFPAKRNDAVNGGWNMTAATGVDRGLKLKASLFTADADKRDKSLFHGWDTNIFAPLCGTPALLHQHSSRFTTVNEHISWCTHGDSACSDDDLRGAFHAHGWGGCSCFIKTRQCTSVCIILHGSTSPAFAPGPTISIWPAEESWPRRGEPPTYHLQAHTHTHTSLI